MHYIVKNIHSLIQIIRTGVPLTSMATVVLDQAPSMQTASAGIC